MSIDDLTLNTASICNLALSHLGMKSLDSDLDTDAAAYNPSALAIQKQWGPCRNDVFREFKWPFATVIGQVDYREDVDSDTYPPWLSFYTYPTSAVTVWHMFDEATADKKDEQQFEVVYNPDLDEKIICSNLDTNNTAYCEYTYNVTDPVRWDTKFIMAFSYRLAAAICMELTGDEKKTLTAWQIYNGYLSEAKRIAHYEKKSKPIQSNPIVNSRG